MQAAVPADEPEPETEPAPKPQQRTRHVPEKAAPQTDEAEAKGSHKTRNIVIGVVGVVVVALIAVTIAMLAGGLSLPFFGNPSNANTPTTPADTSTPWPDGNKTRVYMMQVGDCFDYQTMQSTGNIYAYVLDCSTTHDAEVYGTGQVTDDTFPTADGWVTWASKVCDPAFESYVGLPWYDSELDTVNVHPDEDTWNGDPSTRIITCIAHDVAGGLTGSIQGAKR